MFDTFKYDWPDADGNLIETEFVGREGRSKMLHEDTRTTDIKWKQDPDFPEPLKIGKRYLWKTEWIVEYMLAREHAVRSKKREAA